MDQPKAPAGITKKKRTSNSVVVSRSVYLIGSSVVGCRVCLVRCGIVIVVARCATVVQWVRIRIVSWDDLSTVLIWDETWDGEIVQKRWTLKLSGLELIPRHMLWWPPSREKTVEQCFMIEFKIYVPNGRLTWAHDFCTERWRNPCLM